MSGETEALYDRLCSEGVFEEFGQKLRLTETFVSTRERWRREVADFDERRYAARAIEYTADGEIPPKEIDDRTLADAIAIHETCETIDPPTSSQAAISLERSEAADETPNLPTGFVELSGEEMEPFVGTHTGSVIFCWREDCPPCKRVREDLQSLRTEGEIPESVGLGAVYGPDNVELLYETYAVDRAPTILYCSPDGVASRDVGAPGIERLRTEIRSLLDDR